VRCWEVGADEVAALAPLINTEDVIGALWSPDDGQINPVDCTMMMAKVGGTSSPNLPLFCLSSGVKVQRAHFERLRAFFVEVVYGCAARAARPPPPSLPPLRSGRVAARSPSASMPVVVCVCLCCIWGSACIRVYVLRGAFTLLRSRLCPHIHFPVQ
jgi:hypothetical protein